MNRLTTLILLLVIFSSSVGRAIDFSSLESHLKNFELMSAREEIKKISQEKLNIKDWQQVRSLLHSHPSVGWDILLFWDTMAPLSESKIDSLIKSADQQSLEGHFLEAAFKYQSVIKKIQSKKNWVQGPNYQLYLTLMHSLGRALYGARLFNEAFMVYRKIPSNYIYYKQVQFEIMWTTFRSQKYELTLGSLATQSSGFFSTFLEPEAYIVQYYVYRKICRQDESNLIVKNINDYFDKLKKNEISLDLWLKKDVETLLYNQILSLAKNNQQEKNNEYISLQNTMELRRKADLKRLLDQMELVSAHVNLVQVKKTNELRSNKKLLIANEYIKRKDLETWDVDDNEVWSDELGRHVFKGKNLCR